MGFDDGLKARLTASCLVIARSTYLRTHKNGIRVHHHVYACAVGNRLVLIQLEGNSGNRSVSVGGHARIVRVIQRQRAPARVREQDAKDVLVRAQRRLREGCSNAVFAVLDDEKKICSGISSIAPPASRLTPTITTMPMRRQAALQIFPHRFR